MNRIFLIILQFFILSTFQIKAQSFVYPKGSYLTLSELLDKNPSKQYDVLLEKRTIGDIKMVGGNDYKLVSTDKTIAQSVLRKEVLFYSTSDSLYVNGLSYMVQQWFAPAISVGEQYIVFKAGLSNLLVEQKKQLKLGYYLVPFGGAIQGAKLATLRFLYALDINTNKAITITPESLAIILSSNQTLLKQFENEVEKENEALLLAYLLKFNEGSK